MNSINRLIEKMMMIEGFEILTERDVQPIASEIRKALDKQQNNVSKALTDAPVVESMD